MTTHHKVISHHGALTSLSVTPGILRKVTVSLWVGRNLSHLDLWLVQCFTLSLISCAFLHQIYGLLPVKTVSQPLLQISFGLDRDYLDLLSPLHQPSTGLSSHTYGSAGSACVEAQGLVRWGWKESLYLFTGGWVSHSSICVSSLSYDHGGVSFAWRWVENTSFQTGILPSVLSKGLLVCCWQSTPTVH